MSKLFLKQKVFSWKDQGSVKNEAGERSFPWGKSFTCAI